MTAKNTAPTKMLKNLPSCHACKNPRKHLGSTAEDQVVMKAIKAIFIPLLINRKLITLPKISPLLHNFLVAELKHCIFVTSQTTTNYLILSFFINHSHLPNHGLLCQCCPSFPPKPVCPYSFNFSPSHGNTNFPCKLLCFT